MTEERKNELLKIWAEIDLANNTAKYIKPKLYTITIETDAIHANTQPVFYAYLDYYDGNSDPHHDHNIELLKTLNSHTLEDAMNDAMYWARYVMTHHEALCRTIDQDLNEALNLMSKAKL